MCDIYYANYVIEFTIFCCCQLRADLWEASRGKSVSFDHFTFTFFSSLVVFFFNCQQGSIFQCTHTYGHSESSDIWRMNGRAINKSLECLNFVLLHFVIHGKFLLHLSVIYAKIFVLFIFITSTRVERERRKSKTRGSRSTESLFIDMKVKILACNVESLETNPESVQVLLKIDKALNFKAAAFNPRRLLTSNGSSIVFTRPLMNSPSIWIRAFLSIGAMSTRVSSLIGLHHD